MVFVALTLLAAVVLRTIRPIGAPERDQTGTGTVAAGADGTARAAVP